MSTEEIDPLAEDSDVTMAVAMLMGSRTSYARQRDEAIAAIARIDQALDVLGVEPHEERKVPGTDIPLSFDPREQDPDAYGIKPDELYAHPRPNPVREGGRPVNRDKTTLDHLREWVATLEPGHAISVPMATAELMNAGWTSSAEFPNAVVNVAMGKLHKSGELERMNPGLYRKPLPPTPTERPLDSDDQFDDDLY